MVSDVRMENTGEDLFNNYDVFTFGLCALLGKKRGASLRIAGVSVNAPSLLKHEAELEPLADAIPTNPEERKK